MDLQIKRLPHGKDLPLPAYQTSGSAGFDLYAAIEGIIRIAQGRQASIPTGIAVAVPEGYELQVRPRSGLAAKYGISIVNSPGTVDSDYRGELIILIANTHWCDSFVINRGDRIAQAVIAPVVQVKFLEVDELPETIRGTGGFGSTGI